MFGSQVGRVSPKLLSGQWHSHCRAKTLEINKTSPIIGSRSLEVSFEQERLVSWFQSFEFLPPLLLYYAIDTVFLLFSIFSLEEQSLSWSPKHLFINRTLSARFSEDTYRHLGRSSTVDKLSFLHLLHLQSYLLLSSQSLFSSSLFCLLSSEKDSFIAGVLHDESSFWALLLERLKRLSQLDFLEGSGYMLKVSLRE